MAQVVVGMFTNQSHVENAIADLREFGYDPQDVSVLMKDVRVGQAIQQNTGAGVVDGAVSGGITGAVLLGLTGFLVSVGALAIPGINALFIAGPVASALGLSGVAATTTSAALTGALAGGLVGALMNIGFSEEEAKQYEEHIRAGGILLTVPTRDFRTDEVEAILSRHQATDIKHMELAKFK